jgi:uncharacterized protein YecE (DUF72 family)
MAMRSAGRTAYVYFDNDQKSAAPKDAARLQEMLHVSVRRVAVSA